MLQRNKPSFLHDIMTALFRLTMLNLGLILSGASLPASELRPLLHPLFSDHAVLQRDRPVTIWGWADPGTEVTIRFAEQTQQAIAGPDGRWANVLEPLAASSKGLKLEVETNKPGLKAIIDDVLVGDVWLCSGQSNMEMGIMLCNEDDEIARADHPHIRLLTVPHKTAFSPRETFSADWKPCSPEALRDGTWGGFSAAAYFFGKKLHQELGVPIGLIHSSWGGTVAEAWTSAPALKDFPEFKPILAEVSAIAASTAADPDAEYLDAWFLKHDPGTQQGWFKMNADASAWREVDLPGSWSDCGIPGYEGVVWAQRHIELPAAWADLPLVVRVGEISDNDTTWLNGTVIGRTNYFGVPRSYQIEAGIAKPGTNTITLRVTNIGGGGILTEKAPMIIHPADDESAAIPLAGKWRMQETAKLADTGKAMVGNPNIPSVLYNGMISPLAPAALTGVIWYQGESNASQAEQYRKLLPTLIGDWRTRFQRDDLAFHIVSLANYQAPHEQPRDHPWAELREAQAMTAKNVPHCGLAVAIDIGDAADIHPKNKRDVGKRLALSALAKTYGKPIAGSGPWFRAMSAKDGHIRIGFDHTEGGLQLKGDSTRSFAIAGNDRRFVWANAVIDGDSVIVSSPTVPDPIAVRYAWDTHPQACLYNGAGLPAVPFRSDDWPSKPH